MPNISNTSDRPGAHVWRHEAGDFQLEPHDPGERDVSHALIIPGTDEALIHLIHVLTSLLIFSDGEPVCLDANWMKLIDEEETP